MRINWIAAIFISITHSSSQLRQKLWRWVYNKIASKDVSGKFVFMNYGYHDEQAVRDFAAVKDTAVYNMLRTGKMQYLCYLLQKKCP